MHQRGRTQNTIIAEGLPDVNPATELAGSDSGVALAWRVPDPRSCTEELAVEGHKDTYSTGLAQYAKDPFSRTAQKPYHSNVWHRAVASA